MNLTSRGTWRQPVHELIAVGRLQVRLKLPADVRGKRAQLLVSGKNAPAGKSDGWYRFEVESILDHEVIVIGKQGCASTASQRVPLVIRDGRATPITSLAYRCNRGY